MARFPFSAAWARSKSPREVKVERKPRGAFGLDHLPIIPEDEIHIAVLEWLRVVLPDALVLHPANGGYRDVREATKLKRMGVLAGIPDLLVFCDGAFAFGLEIKTSIGKLSAEQHNIHADMKRLGFHVATVRSIDEARNAVASFGIRTREFIPDMPRRA